MPGSADAASYWPTSLTRLALPYDNGGSDYATVAEMSEAPIDGYVGSKRVIVALVPLGLVEQVLQSTEATGHEVDSQGPLPIVDDDGPPHRSGFWIEGFDRDTRFEPLVNAWSGSGSGSDIDVVVPDNNLLMVFGLVPRQVGTSITWEDQRGPVYNVVRAVVLVDRHIPFPPWVQARERELNRPGTAAPRRLAGLKADARHRHHRWRSLGQLDQMVEPACTCGQGCFVGESDDDHQPRRFSEPLGRTRPVGMASEERHCGAR